MWENFHFPDNTDTSVDWIAQGLRDGSTLWVTDGSHNPQRGPDISGAAWVVEDSKTSKMMACSFAERSPSASSYRAETLGLYSIHAFIQRIADHYNIASGSAEVCCDNDAALKEAKGRRKRIRASSTCSDVFRGIRSVTKRLKDFLWTYSWVKAHMDDILKWQDLSRVQQLNVICDNLAKAAVEETIQTTKPSEPQLTNQLLPLEYCAIYVDSIKQTSDPATQIRYSCGKHSARKFLTTERGWTHNQFDTVDWENLHTCLQAKPDGFRTWLAKQHSDFCATRLQMQRWFGMDDSRCPSCLRVEETAAHLCQCSDPDRRSLLETDVTDLVKWMSVGDNTHPDITNWVEQYILGQGRFPTQYDYIPHSLKELVQEQTTIGWRNFMEGRISTQFHRLQFCHLIHARTNMTASSWVRTFISKLLRITHSQWIFRNFMLHEKTHGLLQMRDRQAILLQVEAFSLSEKNDLPEESQFLLEFDIGRLQQADYETQCYWVAAVEAARTATYGTDQHTETLTQHPLLRRRQHTRPYREPRHWAQAPVETQPMQHRPSPSVRFALEASNIAKKPD